MRTHGLLRVMESVRTTDGNDGVFRAYWGFGARIHHDERLLDFDVGESLADAGLDPSHVSAFEDDSWDGEIRRRMDAGLDLVGNDVGTPIISMDDGRGGDRGHVRPGDNARPCPRGSLAALGRAGSRDDRARVLGAEANPDRGARLRGPPRTASPSRPAELCGFPPSDQLQESAYELPRPDRRPRIPAAW